MKVVKTPLWMVCGGLTGCLLAIVALWHDFQTGDEEPSAWLDYDMD